MLRSVGFFLSFMLIFALNSSATKAQTPCDGLCAMSGEFYQVCMNQGGDPEACLSEYLIYLGWCYDCLCIYEGEHFCIEPE